MVTITSPLLYAEPHWRNSFSIILIKLWLIPLIFSRAASFGDPPKRRKRLKTRGERSHRRAESGDRRSTSQPKSQDSGIVLEESSDQLDTDGHPRKITDEKVRFWHFLTNTSKPRHPGLNLVRVSSRYFDLSSGPLIHRRLIDLACI